MFKNWFLHNENNEYHPYALRLPALFSYILFIVLFNVITARLFVLTPIQTSAQEAINLDQLYSLTNDDRAQSDLPALTQNSELVQAAMLHGQDMFAEQYWGHYSPSGKSPWSFITQSGYSYRYAGENLARDFITSVDINNAWMNSPDHRSNILSSNYTNIGMAIVTGTLNGEQATIVVQMLASPLISNNQNSTSTLQSTSLINKDSVNITGQNIGNTNAYQINLNTKGNANKATASVGNYSSVLSSSNGTYNGVLVLPESVKADNIVQITVSNNQNQVDTYKQDLPLQLGVQTPPALFFIKDNPLTYIQDLIQRVSLRSQVNLIFTFILTLLVAMDAFMYYRLNLKDQRHVNPLLHLPMLIALSFVLIFVNKGSIL